jgi:hypothetical protein
MKDIIIIVLGMWLVTIVYKDLRFRRQARKFFPRYKRWWFSYENKWSKNASNGWFRVEAFTFSRTKRGPYCGDKGSVQWLVTIFNFHFNVMKYKY